MSTANVADTRENPTPAKHKAGIAATILRAPKWLLALILPLATLAVWQFVTVSGTVAPWTLPTPGSVVAAAFELLEDGDLGKHIGISTSVFYSASPSVPCSAWRWAPSSACPNWQMRFWA